MFKKGFTLQELLITIGIIGIVAAIVAPGIVGMMPDQKKMMYMKAYNTLTTLTNEILDDPSLYWTTYDNDGEPNCSGLFCFSSVPAGVFPPCDEIYDVIGEQGSVFCGFSTKFPSIFLRKVNINGTPTSYEASQGESQITFTTTDGIFWAFYTRTEINNNVPGDRELVTDITIDVNPNNDNIRNKCTYSDICTDPDRFAIRLNNDGSIIAVDPLGQAFLRNPTDMHSISEDKEVANDLDIAVNDFDEFSDDDI